MKMRKQLMEQVVGIPIISGSLLLPASGSNQCQPSTQGDQMRRFGKSCALKRVNKQGKKPNVFSQSSRDHEKLSHKITEIVKGKLSFGARLLQMGGKERVFKSLFNVSNKERLIKVSQCYIWTTAGPIVGFLFISTRNIAFCSLRSLKVSCSNGETVKVHYKVLIPLSKMEAANQSENIKKPSQKYLQIVTEDKFEFWFTGFLNYQKTWKHIQQALCLQQRFDEY